MIMKVQGIELIWIVVDNLDTAIKFYTEVIGLELKEIHREYGWAELKGAKGACLGLSIKSDYDNKAVGSDAVITISVDNLNEAISLYQSKGCRLLGNVLEVEGHVKIQTVLDLDGNRLQIVQKLNEC